MPKSKRKKDTKKRPLRGPNSSCNAPEPAAAPDSSAAENAQHACLDTPSEHVSLAREHAAGPMEQSRARDQHLDLLRVLSSYLDWLEEQQQCESFIPDPDKSRLGDRIRHPESLLRDDEFDCTAAGLKMALRELKRRLTLMR